MAMAAMMRETTSRALRRNEYLCSRTTIQDSFSSSSSVAASPRRGGGSLGESLSRGDVGGRARGLPTTTLRSWVTSSGDRRCQQGQVAHLYLSPPSPPPSGAREQTARKGRPSSGTRPSF
eukprot:681397-Hanusia_phi.AAC.3